MNMRRREFLAKSVYGVGGMVLWTQAGCKCSGQSEYYEPYEQVELGRSGIKTSRVSFGTGMRGWMRESNQTRLGREDFEGLIRSAYERGVRIFDAADLYGSHPYLGRALADMKREDYVLMTKIWWRGNGLPEKERPAADVVVQRFLKDLRTDYLDGVMLHCVDSHDWPTELSEQMEILDRLKDKGVIRSQGVSCHSLASLRTAGEQEWTDIVYGRINPYGLRTDGTGEEIVGVLKKVHKAGKGVIGMKLIGEGKLRDSDEKRDASVRFALESGCVDVLNVGFEKIEEIDDFAARVRKVRRKESPQTVAI